MILTIALNLLSAVVYDMLQQPVLRYRARRMAFKMINKASYDSTATWMAMNSSAFLYMKKQSRLEITNIVGLLIAGIAAYMAAGAEYNWHRLGNNPSLVATMVFLINAIFGTLAAMVVIRLHLKTRRLLAIALRLATERKLHDKGG